MGATDLTGRLRHSVAARLLQAYELLFWDTLAAGVA